MDHFDPTKTNAQGQPEIASHFMPLTGPYDSSDEADTGISGLADEAERD